MTWKSSTVAFELVTPMRSGVAMYVYPGWPVTSKGASSRVGVTGAVGGEIPATFERERERYLVAHGPASSVA